MHISYTAYLTGTGLYTTVHAPSLHTPRTHSAYGLTGRGVYMGASLVTLRRVWLRYIMYAGEVTTEMFDEGGKRASERLP